MDSSKFMFGSIGAGKERDTSLIPRLSRDSESLDSDRAKQLLSQSVQVQRQVDLLHVSLAFGLSNPLEQDSWERRG